MQRLTQRQSEILQFIQHYLTHHKMPPTRNEIALHFGFRSKTAAVDHLRALAHKGYIEMLPDLSRGLRLVQSKIDAATGTASAESAAGTDHSEFAEKLELPVIGQVAAGIPIEAIENQERTLSIPANLFRNRPTYLLRVRGNSMRDAGIFDGDLIAVQKTQVAHKGQIVVARIEQEVTVKYLDYENEQVKLVPANTLYQPMLISPNNLFIEGVFVGLIRDASFRL